MSELTDLEICKRIAEIEGVKVKLNDGKLCLNQKVSNEKNVTTVSAIYNPLTDKALCFDLMVKHEIDVSHSYNQVGYRAKTSNCETFFFAIDIEENDVTLAICLAIIAKHKGE